VEGVPLALGTLGLVSPCRCHRCCLTQMALLEELVRRRAVRRGRLLLRDKRFMVYLVLP